MGHPAIYNYCINGLAMACDSYICKGGCRYAHIIASGVTFLEVGELTEDPARGVGLWSGQRSEQFVAVVKLQSLVVSSSERKIT